MNVTALRMFPREFPSHPYANFKEYLTDTPTSTLHILFWSIFGSLENPLEETLNWIIL